MAQMQPGMRVVRGPDWFSKRQDGGEGYVGTLVYVPKQDASDGMVTVVWDSGRELRYRAGKNGKYDLRVLDNATAGIIQGGITCDECNQTPIQGMRWKCSLCDDYDLCTDCYMKGKHDIAHAFVRMDTSMAVAVGLPPRLHSKKMETCGIFQGAEIMRGPHWKWKNDDGGEGQIGSVIKITDWTDKGVTSYHGGVEVKWQMTKKTGTYRLGGEGSVDLIYTKSGKGDAYYPTHLPVVDVISPGEVVLKRSDKVRVNLDITSFEQMQKYDIYGGWNKDMEQCTKELGTVIDLHFGGKTVKVQYEDAKKWTINKQALTRVHSFSNGQPVQILDSYNAVKELQEGHGGWNDEMKDALGQVGRIVRIDKDGDLKVKVSTGHIWVLNPTCCMPCENKAKEEGAPEVNASDDEDSDDEDVDAEDLSRNMNVVADALAQLFVDLLRGVPGTVPGEITLVQAAAKGDLETVKSILEKSPDKVNMQIESKTSLHLASYEGRKEVVMYLLQKKADIEMEDNEGDTALHYAAYGKEEGTLSVLLDHGAKIDKQNKKGQTALHIAIGKASFPCTRQLIKKGANVTIKDKDQDTPMHDAIIQKESQPDLVKFVLQSKTADYTITNRKGFNILHFATLRNFKQAVEIITSRKKGIVNVQMSEGFTALHIAAANDHVEIASFLIRMAQAEINARDKNQRTPLHIAVAQRHKRTVELLISASCDTGAADELGNTALHVAQMSNALPAVLARLLGVKTHDETGLQISSLLIEAGSDISMKNKAGLTPLDLCTDDSTKEYLKKISQQAKTKSFATTQRGVTLPPYWEPMKRQETLKRVELQSGNSLHGKEKESVIKSFRQTLPQAEILRIERIQNPFLWEHYFLTRRRFEAEYGPGCANELDLYHGTAFDVVHAICDQNFDFRLAGERVGTLFGKGTYFAIQAKYSDGYAAPDDNGMKYIFQAKVLAGNMTLGDPSYKRPPAINERDPQSKLFDSCVDDVLTPRIFCVFNQNQYYPEYLIAYK
ncbi:hypothetical protein CHS0354_040103 [Potamilus streckersoni]|uniref:Poly [ADP-ribose] polymerase n=2 Tax=Potamilus streckersoni TaxID=2493646 RepID=A0AAE0VSB9_9BIVA|nr:hypothetical protein CHS0354_040103 [Potamilus streckersoni]